ncbi:MAG: host specificity factor TipJ family phage tail protein [Rhodospirillales bacterium]|nr:host specificity factor TipJ family phage tail protein [Rhodospirillales bacterium]
MLPGAGALMQRSGSAPGALIVATVNGRLVPREDWSATPLRGGEIVTLRAALAGGDDKNPLRALLQIGLLVAAIVVPPLLFTSPWVQTLAGAAITLGGGLIVNALAPLPLPDRSGSSPVEPVYSLTGGANRARPYEPLLLVLGEHRVFPDLGAAEYTEIVDDDHYLHQIFNFGLGDLAVDELKFGDTPLDAYEEVETERGDAQGRITLVAGNVDTAAGAALEDTAFVERATGAATRRIGIDIAGRLFRVDEKDGSVLGHSVDIEIEWEAPGVALERRAITLTHDRPTPLRRTLAYDLGSARDWTVRVRRTTDPDPSDRVYDEIAWAALRAYQTDTADYGGQTRLGVRIRATGQLSGRLDRLSAIVRQRVPAWDGTRWTAPQATSNPAWLFRWYARGVRIAGRLVAGVGLADTRIDESSIKAWGAWCEARGLGCDFVLDRTRSHADVLTLIAQCGRASPSWQTGRLGVVWEDEGRPATALITPGNIVAGSFAVEYAAGQAADEIAVRYIEPALDWQYSTLRRPVPNAGAHPAATATITLHGVTGRNQAAMACNLQAARQLYHRRRLGWEMAAEGLSIARGDVVTITHSLIDGGAAGRLAGGTAARVRLDRPVDPGAGAQLLLRLLDGTVHQSAVSRPPAGVAPEGAPGSEAGETDELDLASPLRLAPGADGDNPRDILWRLYDDALPPVRARIIAMRPSTDRHVHFTAIDEVDAYYDAATADLSAPFPALPVRTPRVLAIAFAENLVRVGAGFAVEIAAVLTVAGDWRGGVVRAAVDDEAPRTVARLVDGETTARWLAQPFGTLRVIVTPGTEAAPSGAPFTATYAITGTLAPPGEPGNFLIDLLGDGTRRFRWTPPDDIDLAGILIRYAVDEGNSAPLWEDMTPLHRGHLTASPLETVEPPPGIYVFAARSIDTGGRLSTGDVRIRATLGPQRQGNALLWRCPSGSGWRGTITNAERSDDGLDALEGLGDYTWDDLTTWDDWQSWATGNGASAATEIGYTGEIVDIGAVLDVGLRWSADTVGEVAFEVRYGATEAALLAADWAAHEPGTTVAARWLQLRWRLSGDGTRVLSLDHLCWSVHAPGAERKLLDRNTADWEGSAADGRIVPNDLAVVTDLDVTLQSVGAGWSWTLLSKNDPTRIRIYDGAGNPADALVDIVVRGVESS